jgi:transketolase
MGLKVIYIFSHDSIGLGEDGPTHQPIEHLAHLRAIPNLNVFRPADTTETLECWQIALENTTSPSVLALTRQKLDPVRKEFDKQNKCSYGAYELSRTNKEIVLTIFASGSEVNLAIGVSHKLATQNIYSKVISVPCQKLLEKQSNDYKEKILYETKYKVSIEAGSTNCWKKFVGKMGLTFGIDDFGRSAPHKNVYNFFGLTSENITKKVKEMINK